MSNKIIPLFPEQGMEQEPDISSMDAEELWAYREKLEEQIARLNAAEPADEESEAYEQWADWHEELEDLLDEVLDYLEDFGE